MGCSQSKPTAEATCSVSVSKGTDPVMGELGSNSTWESIDCQICIEVIFTALRHLSGIGLCLIFIHDHIFLQIISQRMPRRKLQYRTTAQQLDLLPRRRVLNLPRMSVPTLVPAALRRRKSMQNLALDLQRRHRVSMGRLTRRVLQSVRGGSLPASGAPQVLWGSTK